MLRLSRGGRRLIVILDAGRCSRVVKIVNVRRLLELGWVADSDIEVARLVLHNESKEMFLKFFEL